jgi:6-phosphogluconolactonase
MIAPEIVRSIKEATHAYHSGSRVPDREDLANKLGVLPPFTPVKVAGWTNGRQNCLVQLVVVTNSEQALSYTADSIFNSIQAAWDRGSAAHLVLSGGRSGSAMATAIVKHLADMKSNVLHLWFSDERFVEHENSKRNDTAIIAAFADVKCSVLIHRYSAPSDMDLVSAAISYAHDLRVALEGGDFDAVVLSVGEDGHVASVFPDRTFVVEDVFAISDSPKPPSERLSLSLSRIARTRNCIVLALGETKAAVVMRTLAKDVKLPIVVLSQMSEISLITDHQMGNDDARSQP